MIDIEIAIIKVKKSNDKIYVIGEMRDDISSSEYLVQYHEITASPAPYSSSAARSRNRG